VLNADPICVRIVGGVHCDRYREPCNVDFLRPEPAAICIDSRHLVRRAMSLGLMGDAISQRLGTASLANMGNDSWDRSGRDGNIRPQSPLANLGSDFAEPNQSARRSLGRSLLLRAVDSREYRLQAPVWIK